MCIILSIFHPRPQLHCQWDLSQRLLHPHNDFPQFARGIEQCGPTPCAKHEVDGAAAIEVDEVDGGGEFFSNDLSGGNQDMWFVASNLDAKDGFGGMASDEGPFFP